MVVYRCYRTEMEIAGSLRAAVTEARREAGFQSRPCWTTTLLRKRVLTLRLLPPLEAQVCCWAAGGRLFLSPHRGPFEHRRALQTRGPLPQGAQGARGKEGGRSERVLFLLFSARGAITSIFFNLLEDQLVTTSIDKQPPRGSKLGALARHGLQSGR